MSEIDWEESPSASLRIELPDSTMRQLKKLAKSQRMSPEALARLYVGRGLRDELRRIFEEQALEVTRDVVSEMHSDDEANQVLVRVRERLLG